MAAKGILGRKLGMTQVWDEENRVVPVTVIQAGPCRVVQLKTPGATGTPRSSSRSARPSRSRLNKPELGHLEDRERRGAASTSSELRVDDISRVRGGPGRSAPTSSAPASGSTSPASRKGKGFIGAMQRHNFKGQGASHGNHKKHRSPGSIGACATPAQVFKGMKMAGQKGNVRTTTLNLEVVEGDAERGCSSSERLGTRRQRQPRLRPQRGEGRHSTP